MPIVSCEGKADLAVPPQEVSPRDRFPSAADILIHDRPPPTRCSARHPYLQRSGPVHVYAPSARKGKADSARIGARRHDEIVLQPALVPMIDQIDARVDARELHLSVGRYPGTPPPRIAADEVIRLTRKLLSRRGYRVPIGADQPHSEQLNFGFRVPFERFDFRSGGVGPMERWARGWLQRENGFRRSDEEGVSGAFGQKLHARVGLARVRLKSEGEAVEGAVDFRFRVPSRRFDFRLAVTGRRDE